MRIECIFKFVLKADCKCTFKMHISHALNSHLMHIMALHFKKLTFLLTIFTRHH